MKLERRYWKIDDLQGNTDEVDGRGEQRVILLQKLIFKILYSGVIGEYPVLKPGSSHKYASRTSFEVENGKMGGFFTYRKLHKDRSYLLHTPTFKLSVPKMIDHID